MRQLLSILFLSLALAIQYSKQLNYLQCKIANAVRSAAPKCDCENQGKDVKENTGVIPASKIVVHFYFDDYYMPAQPANSEQLYTAVIKNRIDLIEIGCKGNIQKLYRPPRS